MENINFKKRGLRALSLILCAAMMLTVCVSFASISVSAAEGNYKGIKLIPGGVPFGVKFSTEGVVVIGFSDLDGLSKTQNPAYVAGLRPKDIITKINGREIEGASDLTREIENSGGREISLTYTRQGGAKTVRLKPVYSKGEGKYKTGIWVRDSGAGIGTVTYIVPETGEFGGLGHGICDGESGELVPMSRGVVTDVKISTIKKGVVGTPGEIKGYFGTDKCGSLKCNTECGVFGAFSKIPEGLGNAMPICTKDKVKNGEAEIMCTLDESGRQSYKIEISAINRNAEGSKCFVVKVTDPRLIEKTGGIIQGMSGSVICQNGKIVGAVTHVMINDPTVGYGIFIENMLAAAEVSAKTAA